MALLSNLTLSQISLTYPSDNMTAINEMIVVMMGPLFNVAFFAGLMMFAIMWQVCFL
jgi:hypothetical protein